MNETAVYSLLTALLLLCYLIALRCRNIMREVAILHDFARLLIKHPLVEMLATHMPIIVHDEPDDQDVPPAFEQWDES